jgi:hypothetical protein
MLGTLEFFRSGVFRRATLIREFARIVAFCFVKAEEI